MRLIAAVLTVLVISDSAVLMTHRGGQRAYVLSPAAVTVRPVDAPTVTGRTSPLAPSRDRARPHRPPCTRHNWRTLLSPAERYVDWRESRVTPDVVEPHSGAFGLGQLLPATYRDLGLPMRSGPCAQIRAQRVYERERYGRWPLAAAHERRFGWW